MKYDKKEKPMDEKTRPKVYEIVAWREKHGWAYCLNCGDRDELYHPLYKNDFISSEIVECVRCGEVIRREVIAHFKYDNFVACLRCSDPDKDDPLTEQDFLPGEKVVCHYCGKTIKG